jgi:hypothetical protein
MNIHPLLTKIWTLVLLTGVTCLNTSAQSFENIRAVQEGTRMIITYDLVSSIDGATYNVSLLSSHNNFTSPVTQLTGAVGKGQSAGQNKRMEWDLATELKSFTGQVVIELVGLPEVVKLAFRKEFLSSKPKAGKEVEIEWVGGSSEDVKLEVFREGKLVSSLGEKKNNGSASWTIPDDIEKGSGFTLELTSAGEKIESSPFSIKSKPPILIIAGSAAVVSGVVIWLLIANRDLPGAPDPN